MVGWLPKKRSVAHSQPLPNIAKHCQLFSQKWQNISCLIVHCSLDVTKSENNLQEILRLRGAFCVRYLVLSKWTFWSALAGKVSNFVLEIFQSLRSLQSALAFKCKVCPTGPIPMPLLQTVDTPPVDDHQSFEDSHWFESHSGEEQTNQPCCLIMLGESCCWVNLIQPEISAVKQKTEIIYFLHILHLLQQVQKSSLINQQPADLRTNGNAKCALFGRA